MMLPLALKLAKMTNTTLAIDKGKSEQLDTAFTIESACNTNKANSVHSIKKGENGAKMKETIQS
jgi:hypothetical protein